MHQPRFRVRLIGVTLSHFTTSGQLSLFNDEQVRGERLSAALDKIRAKHGDGMLVVGQALTPDKSAVDSDYIK